MGRTMTYVSQPGFIADGASVSRNTGVQIDWANVDVARKNSAGKKVIAAGTILADGAEGRKIPRLDVKGQETAIGILETTAVEGESAAALSGYGCIIGGVIFKNLLPENAEEDFADWIAELNDTGVSTGFAWLTYADDRES